MSSLLAESRERKQSSFAAVGFVLVHGLYR